MHGLVFSYIAGKTEAQVSMYAYVSRFSIVCHPPNALRPDHHPLTFSTPSLLPSIHQLDSFISKRRSRWAHQLLRNQYREHHAQAVFHRLPPEPNAFIFRQQTKRLERTLSKPWWNNSISRMVSGLISPLRYYAFKWF
jgi:hypothetical protein